MQLLALQPQGLPAEIRKLYDAFVDALRAIGPIIVLPEKTRIAFQVRMSFAQLTPRRRWPEMIRTSRLHGNCR
jgi:hypothetical protein